MQRCARCASAGTGAPRRPSARSTAASRSPRTRSRPPPPPHSARTTTPRPARPRPPVTGRQAAGFRPRRLHQQARGARYYGHLLAARVPPPELALLYDKCEHTAGTRQCRLYVCQWINQPCTAPARLRRVNRLHGRNLQAQPPAPSRIPDRASTLWPWKVPTQSPLWPSRSMGWPSLLALVRK
jgi:hypothetical protein